MMHKLLTLTVMISGAIMLSNTASALSCMHPDLIRTLEDAKDSPKTYYILVGNFTSQASGPAFTPWEALPPEDQMKQRLPRIMPSTFEGYSLAKNRRQDVPLTRYPVDIEVSCAGPWCSDVPSPDRELIAFVEARDGQAPLLTLSPCPSQTFTAGSKQLRTIRRCLDKTCASPGP